MVYNSNILYEGLISIYFNLTKTLSNSLFFLFNVGKASVSYGVLQWVRKQSFAFSSCNIVSSLVFLFLYNYFLMKLSTVYLLSGTRTMLMAYVCLLSFSFGLANRNPKCKYTAWVKFTS